MRLTAARFEVEFVDGGEQTASVAHGRLRQARFPINQSPISQCKSQNKPSPQHCVKP